MSHDPAQVIVPLSPFDEILQDGIEQMFGVVTCNAFTFVVNGEEFESTVVEASAISPDVHKVLLLNPLIDRFEFAKGSIPTEDFGIFLEFARSRAPSQKSIASAFISVDLPPSWE
jgi:cobalamin biosynthesis Co2+ chelatase CbiK